MVWFEVNSVRLVGPHFFDGNVNAQSYLQVLEGCVWPAARYQRWTFQHDGAPAHYSIAVRAWLDQKFPGRWMGRMGPIEWPPRSPDLTPPDFFLWGYLKQLPGIKGPSPPSTIPEILDRIRICCQEITPEQCAKACRSVRSRFELCVAGEGAIVASCEL